jgi:hypothetical protein
MIFYVPARICFPNERNDFQEFREILKQLSLTDMLFWCARFIQIMSTSAIKDDLAKQNYVLKFFTPNQIDLLNRFAKQQGGAHNVRIVFRGQLLELLRWALLYSQDRPGDGETFSHPAVQQYFVKACLIASEIWADRVYEGDIKPRTGSASLNQIRRVIDCSAPTVEETTAAGRTESLIMHHLKARYPALDFQFQEIMKMSLEDYYSCASAIALNYLPRAIPSPDENDRPAIFHEDEFWKTTPHMRAELLRFLDVESQTATQLKYRLWGEATEATPATCGPFDYRPLRDRPILRARDGRHIILDPNFMVDKLTVGPLFHISSALRAYKGANKRAVFPAFGLAFEDYARELLQTVYFQQSQILAKDFSSPFLRMPKGKEGEVQEICDGCLNDVSNLVLLELKARWIADEAVYSDNPNHYLSDLKKKAGEGTEQLALAIEKLEPKDWIPVDQDLERVKTVYPVLVVYDRLLDAIGHAQFLAEEFAKFLGAEKDQLSPWLKKGRWRIAPLTVVTVETLELLQTSLKYFTLVEMLHDYTVKHPSRDVTLPSYLGTSKFQKSLRASVFLAKKGLQFLGRTQKRVFNEEESDD